MNHIVKTVGSIVMTFAILGLPVLTCLSFVLQWYTFFRLVLVVAVAIEAIFVYADVYKRSKE